jgi:arsenate reductase (thioredoxin)
MRLRQNVFVAGIVAAVPSFISMNDVTATEPTLNRDIAKYVESREAEFDQIPSDRKQQLERLSEYLRRCQTSKEPAHFIFVCTHNSRRSHMSQLWAAVAAVRYGLERVETFSGGTESTAFNPRAVAAMQRAGFQIETPKTEDNPKYLVSFAQGIEPQVCFSKVYSDSANPRDNFCAIMVCSQADTSCPNVQGSDKKIALPFDDPKVADGTPEEARKYDERAAQICREILYAFSRAR